VSLFVNTRYAISNLANVLVVSHKIDVGKSKSNVCVTSGLQVSKNFFQYLRLGNQVILTWFSVCKGHQNYTWK